MSIENSVWLLEDEAGSKYKATHSMLRKRAASSLSKSILWGFLFILALLNIVQYLKSATAPNPSQIVYSKGSRSLFNDFISHRLLLGPVQHLLSYELRHFGTGKQGGQSPDPSPYLGEPSAELDRVWLDLYPSKFL